MDVKFKLADASSSEKKEGAITLDKWCYDVVNPGKDEIILYIKGMLC